MDASESFNIAVVFNTKSPVKLTNPARTSSPSLASLGKLSPVIEAVFNSEEPLRTTESRGIFSPGLTSNIEEILTSFGSLIS